MFEPRKDTEHWNLRHSSPQKAREAGNRPPSFRLLIWAGVSRASQCLWLHRPRLSKGDNGTTLLISGDREEREG